MIPLLEARHLSALFCGHSNCTPGSDAFMIDAGNQFIVWTPDTNAEQMKECMEAIEAEGYNVDLRTAGNVRLWKPGKGIIKFDCRWRHFPMYAAAELERRKE